MATPGRGEFVSSVMRPLISPVCWAKAETQTTPNKVRRIPHNLVPDICRPLLPNGDLARASSLALEISAMAIRDIERLTSRVHTTNLFLIKIYSRRRGNVKYGSVQAGKRQTQFAIQGRTINMGSFPGERKETSF
jgi:hypothetical protein